MYQGTPLTLRPEALEAAKTGKRVITEFERFGERFAWVFYPNGLQVLLLLRKLPFVRIRVGVRTGALDDLVPGTLHALEHMLVKDVLEIGPHPAIRHLQPYGLGVNASTGYDQMSLYAKTIYRYWRDLLKGLLTMAFSASTLDQERWEHERPAIEQEINSATEEVRVDSAIRIALHPHIPELHPIPYGTLESVAQLNASQLRDRYHQDFTPQNSLISMQGVADLKMALKEIDVAVAALSRISSQPHPSHRSPLGDELRLQNLKVRVRESTGAERIRLLARIPSSVPRSIIEAAFILVQTYGSGGLLRDEFRRVRGWTYGQGMSLEEQFGGSYIIGVNAKMKAEYHEEAKAAFQALWRETCLSLPRPQSRVGLCFDAGRGSHALSIAERRLRRGGNYARLMNSLWLEQDLPRHRPLIEIPPDEFPAIARHAPKLADLDWHMVSVVRDI